MGTPPFRTWRMLGRPLKLWLISWPQSALLKGVEASEAERDAASFIEGSSLVCHAAHIAARSSLFRGLGAPSACCVPRAVVLGSRLLYPCFCCTDVTFWGYSMQVVVRGSNLFAAIAPHLRSDECLLTEK